MMKRLLPLEESLLIKILGKSPQLRIVDFFLDNRSWDFSKKEIIEEIKMSRNTFYKVWDYIENLDIVRITRKFGNVKLYQLNKNNPLVQMLIKLDERLMIEATEKIPIEEKISSQKK